MDLVSTEILRSMMTGQTYLRDIVDAIVRRARELDS